MYALKDETPIVAAHAQHAFHAKDVLPLVHQQIANPLVEFFLIEVARMVDADGRHPVVVDVVRLVLAAGRGRECPFRAAQLSLEFVGMMLG